MSNINRSDPTNYSDSTDIDDLSISSDAGNTAASLKYGRGPATNFDSNNSNIIHLGKSRQCDLKLYFYFIFERLYSAHFVHKRADGSIYICIRRCPTEVDIDAGYTFSSLLRAILELYIYSQCSSTSSLIISLTILNRTMMG